MTIKKGKEKATPDSDTGNSLIFHLTELRGRVLRIFIGTGIIFLVLYPFANELYQYLSAPLLKFLPTGTSMIAIEVASPFLTPFKLTLMTAIVIAIPYIFHQIWTFISPGLYQTEQRFTLPLLVSSTLLFYLGIIFAYFVVFPLIFGFFTAVAPVGVTVMTDIARYLDFVFKIFFAFGIAFEVPIATILLIKLDIVSVEELAAKRPYIIVGAFVIGMILTPPDVISQVLLAIPIWILFELGLLFARWMPATSSKKQSMEQSE